MTKVEDKANTNQELGKEMTKEASKKKENLFEDMLAPVLKNSDILNSNAQSKANEGNNNSNDLFQAHNFEINIDLSVPITSNTFNSFDKFLLI
jgi:hypothetical protein